VGGVERGTRGRARSVSLWWAIAIEVFPKGSGGSAQRIEDGSAHGLTAL